MPQNNAMPFFKRTGNVKEGQIEETVKAQWNPGDSNPQLLNHTALYRTPLIAYKIEPYDMPTQPLLY